MLPKTINALVGECKVRPLEDTRRYRGLFRASDLTIYVDTSHPLSWQAQTLIHEMSHLACTLLEGFAGDGDEREENYCYAMGRFLTPVLMENIDLLTPTDTLPKTVTVLGERWKVEQHEEPHDEELGVTAWLHSTHQTMRVRIGEDPQVIQMRLFQLTCQAVLSACQVEDWTDTYYWKNSGMLYALLKANPQAHPKVVMANG